MGAVICWEHQVEKLWRKCKIHVGGVFWKSLIVLLGNSPNACIKQNFLMYLVYFHFKKVGWKNSSWKFFFQSEVVFFTGDLDCNIKIRFVGKKIMCGKLEKKTERIQEIKITDNIQLSGSY